MLDDPFERRRAERRYAMNFLDYEIVSSEGETIGRGLARTLNVSASGLLLETGQFFEAEQLLRITLGLENELVQVTGRVAYSRPIDDSLCTTGVQFVEFAEAERRIFQRYFELLSTAPVK
ncbi:MAG: PilZ domain-containing protein [Desulfuromonadales bacterium]|nr:PilZ domain-containing protein [Desulfuromonadales bacterium]